MARLVRIATCWIAAAGMATMVQQAFGQQVQSHPPMRPLPSASQRPMTPGRGLFVDPKAGNDADPGSRKQPWQTLNHAAGQLQPGDVLYLRGGVYYDHVRVDAIGTEAAPITIRSFPGELAIIDGGLREFFETPGAAWQPYADGADGEFRSAKPYPDLGGSEGSTNVLGSFGDSMVPLHGYRYLTDLRNLNEYFSQLGAGKTEAGDGIYCGPGVFYDVETKHLHVRLAHTHQRALGEDNYHGETDPRKVPLVIAGLNAGPPLTIEGARYLRVQDLVVRGARTATISVNRSFNVEFDGVTAYGGSTAMAVRDSAGLRLWNCALRGIAAPWTYRGSLKYRAIEARIFSASGWNPTGQDSHDFELAYSEFTDCVDGVFIGNVKNVRFHHNLLDNISDDGFFLTATTAYDGTTPGGKVQIYQNLLSRCLTTFAFGVGHGRQKMTPSGRQTGSGVNIYRNLFDLRRPVMYTQPGEDEPRITSFGRVSGDHGGPLWEPMTIYHNTIVHAESPSDSYYLSGLGSHMAGGSMRRLFNNAVVMAKGQPGSTLPPLAPPEPSTKNASSKPKQSTNPLDALLDGVKQDKREPSAKSLKTSELARLKSELEKRARPKPRLTIDFQADGNLHWSYANELTAEAMFSRFRTSPDYEASKEFYPLGSTSNDVVADPRFAQFQADWRGPIDCQLRGDSPAVDAGVDLPDEWPDPLRKLDRERPDIGVLPVGVQPCRVGVGGRLSLFGSPADRASNITAPGAFLLADAELPGKAAVATNHSAVVVQGYPAFDAPLIEFALRRFGIPYESLQRTWLSPAEYEKYQLVIVAGDLPRAKIEPNQYSDADLSHVEQFLNGGGTLMLMRGNTALFNTEGGRRFLSELTGSKQAKRGQLDTVLAKHPWTRHLDPRQPPPWIGTRNVQRIRATTGEIVIGDPDGSASLYRLPVGKGQLIYVGWDISAALPHGRRASTVEQETAYEQQMQILLRIVESIAPPATR